MITFFRLKLLICAYCAQSSQAENRIGYQMPADKHEGPFIGYQMPADKHEGLNACLCLLRKNLNNLTELGIRSVSNA